ncbi:MAG: hypothetical protein DMF65_05045, partial [Acidobacteria bacterium]
MSQTAILCGERRLTYAQLLGAVRKFGGALKSLGVEAGERVAIVSADCPEFVAAFLGTSAVGSVAVPASTMSTPSELEYVLAHSGARAAVVTSEQLDKLRLVRSRLPRLETILLVGDAPSAASSSDDAGEGTLSFDEALDGLLSFDEVLDGASETEVEDVEDDAPAFILYTSGSTGRPKGATHVHRNLPYTVETY